MAAVLCRDTNRIEVILSGGGLASPLVVRIGIRVSKRLGLTGLNLNWNSLRFGTRVVSSADGNHRASFVGGLDTTLARNTQALGQRWVGKMKLAVLALNTTDGLTGSALCCRPL